MPKPDMEHLDVDEIEWTPIPGDPGCWEKILSLDEETGSYTRLLKIDPGYESEKALVHDFWEETYTLKGSLFDRDLDKIFKVGTYSCVPPGKRHGPYKSPQGYLSIEFRYYR